MRRSTSAVVPSPWLIATSARAGRSPRMVRGAPVVAQEKRRPSRRPPSGSQRLTIPSLVPSRTRPSGSSTTPWRILRCALERLDDPAHLHIPDVRAVVAAADDPLPSRLNARPSERVFGRLSARVRDLLVRRFSTATAVCGSAALGLLRAMATRLPSGEIAGIPPIG